VATGLELTNPRTGSGVDPCKRRRVGECSLVPIREPSFRSVDPEEAGGLEPLDGLVDRTRREGATMGEGLLGRPALAVNAHPRRECLTDELRRAVDIAIPERLAPGVAKRRAHASLPSTVQPRLVAHWVTASTASCSVAA